MAVKTYSLNLSSKYSPKWGAWEIAREIICNAKDTGLPYTVETPSSDTMIVTTQSVPNVAELFVIGEGSKTERDAKIGQFGEGFKLSALCATRGGTFSAETPTHHFKFGFEDYMGAEVLHATVEEVDCSGTGFRVTIKYPGITESIKGKFLDDSASGIIKDQPAGRIFCKGVYICDLPNALYAWNLNGLTLNRDRAIPSQYSIGLEIRGLIPKLDNGTLMEIVNSHDSLEHDPLCTAARYSAHVSKQIADVIKGVRGDNCFLVTNVMAAGRVVEKTKQPMAVLSDSLTKALCNDIPTDTQILNEMKSAQSRPTSVSPEPYIKLIDWLRGFDAVVSAPKFKLVVMENYDDNCMGLADISEKTVYINERLFKPGNKTELAATYLHELAHIMSGAEDETSAFEDSLTKIAGRLAMEVC